MVDNTLGTLFTITLFGESHGKLIGIIIDGAPAGIELDLEFIQEELNKRKPGQSNLTTSRKEEDKIKIVSGVFENKTTGAPICLYIENKDIDSSQYEKFKHILRPSHIDYSALKKYGGYSDYRGSGRFSGRITAGFVMAGAIAKQILSSYDISIFAYTKSVGNIVDENDYNSIEIKKLKKKRDDSPVRTIDPEKSEEMGKFIKEIKTNNDSIGGIVKCIIRNFPAGKGGPIFNSLESEISHAIFSIPGIKGIEFGAGFKAASMKGSEHNDPWILEKGEIMTTKNSSGGIIGGISTGMPIEFKIVVKPPATIGIPQKTVNIDKMDNIEFAFEGRHDPCIAPRVVPVVEAITAVVLLDRLMVDGFIPKVFKSD